VCWRFHPSPLKTALFFFCSWTLDTGAFCRLCGAAGDVAPLFPPPQFVKISGGIFFFSLSPGHRFGTTRKNFLRPFSFPEMDASFPIATLANSETARWAFFNLPHLVEGEICRFPFLFLRSGDEVSHFFPFFKRANSFFPFFDFLASAFKTFSLGRDWRAPPQTPFFFLDEDYSGLLFFPPLLPGTG